MNIKIFSFILSVVFLLQNELTASSGTYKHYMNLYEFIIKTNYSSNFLPKCKKDDKLTVNIDVALRELVNLSEKYQLLKLKIWVRLKWKDCALKWNPEEYENISQIIVPYNDIWIPDITLYEGVSDMGNMPDMEEYRASLLSNGRVKYIFPTTITAACKIDVTYFPFDQQNCSLTLGSWIYPGKDISVVQEHPTGDVSSFLAHNEWKLLSMFAVRHETFYKCCVEPFSEVKYHLVLKRYPKFYLITIIFPCILVTGLTFMGFCLPPSCSEKISLQITVLLSITVFLLLIQDQLPSSSETFPIIAIYFATAMVLVCLASIMAGIVLLVYYKRLSGKKLPVWMRLLFLDACKPLMCSKNYISQELNVASTLDEIKRRRKNSVMCIDSLNHRRESIRQNSIPEEVVHNGDCGQEKHRRSSFHNIQTYENRNSVRRASLVSNNSTHEEDTEDIEHHVYEWILCAYILDRLFFVIYVVLFIINSFMFVILFSSSG